MSKYRDIALLLVTLHYYRKHSYVLLLEVLKNTVELK